MSGKKIIIITLIVIAVLVAGVYSMYAYYNAKLDTMREASIKAMRESVTLSDYNKKNQEKINALLDEGEKQIQGSTQQYEIDRIVATTEGEIENIKTIKQDRKEARAKLKSIVSLSNYRDDQKKQVKSILKK